MSDKLQWDSAIKFMEETLKEKLQQSECILLLPVPVFEGMILISPSHTSELSIYPWSASVCVVDTRLCPIYL